MPPSLSLAGVLIGGIGGYVVATMFDHHDPLQRHVGCAIGVLLIVIGTGVFFVGLFQ